MLPARGTTRVLRGWHFIFDRILGDAPAPVAWGKALLGLGLKPQFPAGAPTV